MPRVVVENPASLADWLTAGGTLASVLIVLVAAVAAWRSLEDARRTRHAELVLKLNDQWSGLSDSFKLYWKYPRDPLAALVDRLYGPNQPRATSSEQDDFEGLRASVNLIETIGVLRADGALTTRLIYRMWGGSILAVWLSWEAALPKLRSYTKEPDMLRGFEALSRDIQEMMQGRAPGRLAPRGGATEAESVSRAEEGVAPGTNADE
jgi:hypothetical protein